MPRDGSGEYTLPSPQNPVVSGTTITADWANTTLDDVAAQLTNSIAADGQTEPLADLPMAGLKHTACADPSLRNQYVTLGMTQDGRDKRITITSTDPNNITGTLVGNLSAYYPGMTVSFFAAYDNTGAVNLNVNGVGSKSLLNNAGSQLVAGDLQADQLYMAYYSGTAWVLLVDTGNEQSGLVNEQAVSGWRRPTSGTYPSITLASSTSVTVPAGEGYIIPPTGTPTLVSWVQQEVELIYVTSGFSTTLYVDDTGTIQQFSGRMIPNLYRNGFPIASISHPAGTISNIVHHVSILGDDRYLSSDIARLVENRVVYAGRVSGNLLTLDAEGGLAFVSGGTPNDSTAPNTLVMAGGSPLSFRTLLNDGTLGAPTTTVPVANYDPAGAGTLTALTGASNATIHRLYWLYGDYIFQYGQTEYQDLDHAVARVLWDRSTFNASGLLGDAVLVAELIIKKSAADLSLSTDAIIISSGGAEFYIGSPSGIPEAPIDGNTYGRKNGTWSTTIDGSAPVVTGASPTLKLNMDPVGAASAAIDVRQLNVKWFGIEIANPGDKAYLRSYNPATGVLRYEIEYDLATGDVTFPSDVIVNGNPVGDVVGPGSATDNGIVLFDGVTGRLVKSSDAVGTSAYKNIQTTQTDTTAGRVMRNDGFGLGTTEALNLPGGTTAQRPTPTAGMLRYNSDTPGLEAYIGGAWTAVGTSGAGNVPNNYLTGLTISNNTGASPTYGIDIAVGQCKSADNSSVISLSSTMGKLVSQAWTAGGTPGAPVGGSPSSILPLSYNQWLRVFLIWKSDLSAVDVGFDTSATATALLGEATGYTKYRQIGSVRYGTGALLKFKQNGDDFQILGPSYDTKNLSCAAGDYTVTALAPPSTVAQIQLVLAYSSGSGTEAYIQNIDEPAAAFDTERAMVNSLWTGSTSYSSCTASMILNSSSQYKLRNSTTTSSGYVLTRTLSWKDTRGK